MTSSSDTFPFGIADVVELLGLTVRRRLPSSLYLNCPFCGDQRGRLNVNTDKNVWRCNRCGAAGGMLALYARYNCTGNADAYREICEALGRYTPRPRVNDCIGVKPEQNVRATPQEIHQTYSLLLSMLPLTPTHKAHLLSPRRGLTEEQIARFGFKSTPPAFLCRSYAERLQRQGCTLQGVPGFYTDNAGRWTINFGSRTAGILLPAVGMDGLICGMQIRLDTPLRRRDDPPGKSGAKYIWLSSIGKPHGVTSGSPLHFVGEPFAKTVYVTEGLLKADVLRSSAKPPKIRKCPKQKEPCLKKSGTTLCENVQPFWLNPILNILIVTYEIIHVYTITVRMLCRCNASAAKNFQGSASGAILILWRIGIIMQKKAKKRNHRFYG